MSKLLELADRVEALTGPDRGVDGAICLALGWTFQKMKGDSRPYYRKPGVVRFYQRTEPPAYTASLDAAMTLVPEGWRFAGLFERNCQLPNWIWKAEFWHPEADQNVRGIARNADYAALALCAAALRARHAVEGEK